MGNIVWKEKGKGCSDYRVCFMNLSSLSVGTSALRGLEEPT